MSAKTTNGTLRKQLLTRLAETEADLRSLIDGITRVYLKQNRQLGDDPVLTALRESHDLVARAKQTFCCGVPLRLPELDRKGELIRDEPQKESMIVTDDDGEF